MTDYLTRTDNYVRGLGFEAYRVGGSVRDELLGRRVKDADYMVRGVSLPDLYTAVAQSGANASMMRDRERRPLGVRAHQKGLGLIEITLPRAEVSTGPGHRDFDIELAPTLPLHEDCKRRDFTFNALYKHLDTNTVADPTGAGLYDLQHRLVRTTYSTSFRDDPLRTLRALRFVSVLGYDLTQQTKIEMIDHADAVTGLTSGGGTSGTVYDEFCKLLMGADVAKALRLAAFTGVLAQVMPELAPMIGFDQGSRYHDMTTDEHTFKALETAAHVEAPLRVRWALLFHDCGKPASAWIGADGRKHYYAKKLDTFDTKLGQPTHISVMESAPKPEPITTEDHEVVSEWLWREACERMNVPKSMREDVAKLVRHHMVTVVGKVKPSKVRRARVKFGDELLRDLYMHRMCDLSGKGAKVAHNHIAQVAKLEKVRQDAVRAKVPASTKELAVTGKDCIEMGMKPENIGKALNAVLADVVSEPTETLLSREWQLKRLERV